MGNLRYVFAFSAALLLANCTRKTESTSFTIKFPQAKVSSAVSIQGASGTWNSSLNPSALTDVNCYAVFIDSPQLPQNSVCTNPSGTEIIKAGLVGGLYRAGETATISVPTANKTKIMIAGIKSADGACENILRQNLTFSNYSYPFLLATETRDLVPGDMEVNINLQAQFDDAHMADACTLPKLRPGVDPLLIFGQPAPNVVRNLRYGLGAGGARGMFQANGKTFISDCANQRLLVYNTPPTGPAAEADLVLGQKSADEMESGAVTARSIGCAADVHFDGSRLFVADPPHHRVLIWNSFPVANNQAADVVLGQPDFISFSANNGGTSAKSLNSPYAVKTDGTSLFIADKMNSRVLVWNSIPTTNFAAADFVLGQTSFTTGTFATTANGLKNPADVEVNGSDLWVADTGNNRVLAYSLPISANGMTAAVVLGQSGFSTSTSGCTANQLNQPGSIAFVGGRMFIADVISARVTAYNSVPSSNNASANFVLGQSNLTACGAPGSTSGSTFTIGAGAISALNGGISLAAAPQNRILVWNSVNGSNQQAADWVYGQGDLTESVALNPQSPGASRLTSPSLAISDGVQMAAVDSGNNRVLIWNALPAVHGGPAQVVVGQADMTSYLANGNAGISSSVLYNPTSALVQNGKFYVSDTNNNRILGWNAIPASNNSAADFVLGQTDFISSASGYASGSLNAPGALASDSVAMAVADTMNHRVLVWNSLPTSSGQNPNLVIGQTGFTTPASGCTSSKLNTPFGVALRNGKLIVADTMNHRVLIWNNFAALADGQAADVVLGQTSMTSCNPNQNLSPAAGTMKYPRAVAVDERGYLYVSDNGNNRILVWKSLPAASNTPADLVLGQIAFSTNSPNQGGVSALSLSAPTGLHVQGGNLWITDSGNHRVIRRPLPP